MYLLIYLLIYIFFVFFLRTFLLWKRTGINPLTFKNGDDAHGFNGKVYAFSDYWRDYLLPLWYLENPFLQKIGWVLLLISLILVWVAQSQMANSWRIGIDAVL